MQISFFIGRLTNGGGAERVISNLANYYITLGWNVDICLLLNKEDNKEHYYLNPNINLIDLSCEEDKYINNIFGWMNKIHKYAKSKPINCIVSFVGRINALVLTSTVGLKIPTLVSERNDPKHDGRSKLMNWYCSLIYELATIIVFQNTYQQKCFPKKLSQKSCIIANPVEVNEDYQIENNNSYLITSVGRLTKQKNYKLLIDAIAIVKEICPCVHCIIYGEGNLREELSDYIKKKKLSEYIELFGNTNEVHKLISKSSIYVTTSDYEGQSNALIEAMMLGKACISTNYEGVEEVISDGVNGLITPCRNAEKLADKILFLIKNENGIRNIIAENAKKSSVKYKADIVLSQWDEVISSISKK
jgi:glycosyltransferase involved in cell wall biosynthesis